MLKLSIFLWFTSLLIFGNPPFQNGNDQSQLHLQNPQVINSRQMPPSCWKWMQPVFLQGIQQGMYQRLASSDESVEDEGIINSNESVEDEGIINSNESVYNEENPECYEYKELEVGDRDISFSGGRSYCDNLNAQSMKPISRISPGWKGTGWYRFNEQVYIPESNPGTYLCGTICPGYLSGTHPVFEGEKVEAKVCFCNKCDYATTIKITRCSDYFVYFLKDVPHCNLKYCIVRYGPD